MGIDEVMVGAPSSSRTSTAREGDIIDDDSPDDFILCERTLESHFPCSLPIDISSEIYEISGDIRVHSIEHLTNQVDKIAFSDSSEFERDIPMKDHLISGYFYVSIISMSRFLLYLTAARFTIPISELCETTAYCRIKISI